MSHKSRDVISRPPIHGKHGGRGVGIIEKSNNFKGTMIKLVKYLKPYWGGMIIAFVIALASAAFGIVGPKLLGDVTTQIAIDYTSMMEYDRASEIGNSDTERPSINFEKIKEIMITLVILYVLSSVFLYIQSVMMAAMAQKVTYTLRKNISEKIDRMPVKYFDSIQHGDVLSRVTNDIDTVNQTLNQSLSQTIVSVTSIIGILIMMFSINIEMTFVALLVLPVSMGLIGAIIKKSQKFFVRQQKTLGDLNGHIEEMYSSHVVVKAFNGEESSVESFKKTNDKLYDSAWKSQFFSGLSMPLMGFVGNLGYVAVSVMGGYMGISGRISIGDIQAFIQYLKRFNHPIMQAGTIAGTLQSTAAAAERIFEFLEQEEEASEHLKRERLKDIKGDVEFDNVVFGYSSEKMIINGFTASIKAGQRVAIVGPTGAGKTTVINLLMRFYELNSGCIKVDGADIADMKSSDVRRIFGIVLQETWLFNGSIRDNIKYSKEGASDEEVTSAAKSALADHFINFMPSKYDMEINEEASNISQGQKQLLTIARAMLANPAILILDEATSSVDTRTEILIQKAMDNLMKGRTSFVIAHRLSTIRDADLILVMKDGNIIEQGTHNKLLEKKGFYEELYNSQFGVTTP